MPVREVLSPLINLAHTPQRPFPSKFVSPSTSRTICLSSPTPNFAIQDEDIQKKDRRRKSQAFDFHRKVLASPSSNSPRPSDELQGLTSAQLSNHYADCIKLSAENKINAKNAFGLHLIDYMTELVKKKEMENFQLASSTLDASVKIYAGRVDFIHSHAYKVLSGLGGGKSSLEEDAEAGENLEEAGEDKELEIKTKKKKRAGKANTVESNLKNINADKFDLEFEVDPMFHMMSAAFDEGGARGLLLNRLRCFDDTQQLVLDSSTAVNVVEDVLPDLQITRKPIDICNLKEWLSNISIDDKQICPALAEFHFTGWSGETSVGPKTFSDFAFDPTAKPQHLPTVEEEVEAIAHEHINDFDGDEDQPEHESVTNNEDFISVADCCTAEFVESAFNDLTHGSVDKLRQILATTPSDYSYFNKILLRTWAGPAHWKIAPASKTGKNNALENKGQKKRQKKVAMKLTYDTPASDLDKMFKISKATTVTKATWSKYTKKNTTLPEDQHLDNENKLFHLFHLPRLLIKQQQGDTTRVDDGIDNYDYNNKNDVENFCPVVQDDDENNFFDLSNENSQQASQNSISQQSGFLDSGLNGTIFTQDKLVTAPHKVAKIDIKYARTAKRVDVRKLKMTMWSLLTRDKPLTREEPFPAGLTEDLIGSLKMNVPHYFQELKDSLPSQVSTTMAKNLTIQTVFACLLYIANEKILKLSNCEDMDNIYIEQDKS